jgi:hypothetical protein
MRRKRKKKFILVIPELCIVGKDEDLLGKAYEKLESKKEDYFVEMIETGFEEDIRKPEKKS